jgi:hypothetical protein
MIFDTLICNFLFNKKFDNKFILLLMSFYYFILYILLYIFIFKKAFSNQNILIPCLVITLCFLIFRIFFIKRYIESKK